MDQQLHPALALLAANPQFFAQHGTVSAYWRHRGDKKYGPYYRLRYRDGQSTRTVYLGRQSPQVDRVRQTLQTLQRPQQERRALNQLHREIRNALRIDRRHVDAQLRSLGLHLKGFEVRGWRTSPVRNLARIPRTPQAAVAAFTPPKLALPASIRLSQLRFVLSGRAAQWTRESRPKIPRSPSDRLEAFLDARDRIQRTNKPRSAGFNEEDRGRENNRNRRRNKPLWQTLAANLTLNRETFPTPMRR